MTNNDDNNGIKDKNDTVAEEPLRVCSYYVVIASSWLLTDP